MRSLAQLVEVPVPIFDHIIGPVGQTEDAEHGRRDIVYPLRQEVVS